MYTDSIPKSGNSQVQASIAGASPGSPAPSIEKGAEAKQSAPDLDRMRAIAVDLQRNIKVLSNVNLGFAVHQSTGKVMVTVTDEDTGKVIREIPNREMLNVAAKLEEMTGVIFDLKI